MSILRAAGYARFSTDKQCSIDIQFAQISAYCQQHQLELSPAHLYSDEGKSGMLTTRGGYQQLLTDARSHAFDAIILYDITRGNRDISNWFAFRREMKRLHIQVISLNDHLGDIDDPADFLPELIAAGMGQTHVLTSRKKSMDKVDYLAAQGKFLGGLAPFGYRIEAGKYVIVPEEAEIVRLIFDKYAHGASYAQIMAALPPGLTGRRGRPIGKNSLITILRNERYAGTYSWCTRQVRYFTRWAGGGPSERSVRIEGAIPPIIDRAIWQKARYRMETNKPNILNHGKREYLLSGLLHCGACGGAFGGVTTVNKKGYEYKFYTCLNKRRTRQCKAKNLAANDIEPLILSLLRRALQNDEAIQYCADAILDAGKSRSAKNDLAEKQQQLAEVERKISNLVKVLASGFDSDPVRDELSALSTRKIALTQQITQAQARSTADGLLTRDFLMEQLRADAAALLHDSTQAKQLIQKYIVRIDVFDDQLKIVSALDLSRNPSAISLEKGKSAILTDDGLTTNGCGGAFHTLFTITCRFLSY